MPILWFRISKTKQSAVKNNIEVMNRAEQAYFLEYREFTDSLQQLGVGIKNPSDKYEYSIRVTPLTVFNYAIPRRRNIKGYVGAIFLTTANENTDEIYPEAIFCEAISPGITRPADPIVRGNTVECGSNTRNLFRAWDKEYSKLGKDSVELAYSSFNYATAGQYDKALGVAQTINNADLKARALATIAIELAQKGQYDKALEVAKTIKDDFMKQSALDAIAQYQKSP